MSARIAHLEPAAPEAGRTDDSGVHPDAGARKEPEAVFPAGGKVTEVGELRIQEDPSTVITFRDSALPFSPGAPPSTSTQSSASGAAVRGEIDEKRLLALQVMNLEWTSLPYELQRAVVMVLGDLPKER